MVDLFPAVLGQAVGEEGETGVDVELETLEDQPLQENTGWGDEE